MKTWVKEVIFIVVVASILIGCMALNGGAMVRIYPNKPLQPFIDVRAWEGYEINSACPYETMTTDTGYDLIIHFVKE